METTKDNSTSSAKTGLLLIKIGVGLSFVLPIVMILAFGSVVGQFGFFSAIPDFFIAIMISFIAIGGALSIVALKFGIDANKVRQRSKADYAIILGVVVFLVGSNLSGILIAIGGNLIRKSI